MSNFHTLFDAVGVLARRRYQIADRHFSTLGFNHTEARLLTLLQKQNGSAAQDALAGALTVDRSNSGRALRNLEQKGYIRRQKDSADKRANLVQITSEGNKAASEIAKIKKKIVQEFTGALSEADAAAIVNLLRKIIPDDDE